ncbi:MAG: hypothetical protein HC882_09320 [Acidobacteria bacterium]|nr:hypothetical protein [Acidobacteriota bacterium]
MIESEIRGFLRSRFPGFDDKTGRTASLESVVDSLGVFDVAEWVEGKFAVKIPNEEFTPRRFESIDAIIETIRLFGR